MEYPQQPPQRTRWTAKDTLLHQVKCMPVVNTTTDSHGDIRDGPRRRTIDQRHGGDTDMENKSRQLALSQ